MWRRAIPVPGVASAHRAVSPQPASCGASPVAIRLMASSMLLRDGGVVDMGGLGLVCGTGWRVGCSTGKPDRMDVAAGNRRPVRGGGRGGGRGGEGGGGGGGGGGEGG